MENNMNNNMIAEENERLLTLFAVKMLLDESKKAIEEIIENTKLNFETIGVVDYEKALQFESGLKLAYTKPKELTEKDYDAKIEKAKKEYQEWERKKADFLDKESGCVDLKSEPILKFQTTTDSFKKNLAKKQQQLLAKHPLFTEIKNTVKQIEN